MSDRAFWGTCVHVFVRVRDCVCMCVLRLLHVCVCVCVGVNVCCLFTRCAAMRTYVHSPCCDVYVCSLAVPRCVRMFTPRDSRFDPLLIPRGEKPKTARKEQVTKISHMRVLLVPRRNSHLTPCEHPRGHLIPVEYTPDTVASSAQVLSPKKTKGLCETLHIDHESYGNRLWPPGAIWCVHACKHSQLEMRALAQTFVHRHSRVANRAR